LKNAVVFADNVARDADVIDVLFHQNTPTLVAGCDNQQVRKFH
jgi:hypothetical protein